MRNIFAKCLLAAALAITSASCRNDAYTTATRGTLSTLTTAARVFQAATAREVSADYLADLKSVPDCLRIINRLPGSVVTSTMVLDAWGNAIIFTPTTPAARGHFRSPGPDGIVGNADDLIDTP
jgi:hypothetical protein